MTNTHAITVRHLTHRYRTGKTGFVAVDDVSFHVERGEVYGLLGTNGAGKTTTLEILEGLTTATDSEISVLGMDPVADRPRLRRHIDPELAAQTISAGQSPLTEREAELLELAGRGGSVEDIAAAAFLAPGTTRNYLSSAMNKVGAQNRFEAYTRARELGWI